jgi:hypothetical protein
MLPNHEGAVVVADSESHTPVWSEQWLAELERQLREQFADMAARESELETPLDAEAAGDVVYRTHIRIEGVAPEPRGFIGVRVDAHLIGQVDAIARRWRTTRSAVIREALVRLIDREADGAI